MLEHEAPQAHHRRADVLALDDVPRALGVLDEVVHEPVDAVRAGDIEQGKEVGAAMMRLRAFMFQNVYLGPTARAEHAKIERVMRGLFDWFCDHPEELEAEEPDASQADRVIDYLAGMTDRFAIRAWTERAVPQGLLH